VPLALQQCTLTDEVMLMDCTLPAFTLDDTLPTVSMLWRVQLNGWAKITPGRDYETFSAWLCALDLFIPLDALGQKNMGAPGIARLVGSVGLPAALGCPNGRLSHYGHGRGCGHRVDRSAGLTFAPLRVMGDAC